VTSDGAYLVGREIVTELPNTQSGADRIYASVRVDGDKFEDLRFRHCTFANVSFKGCALKELSFNNCVFIDCYFRDTRIERCRFYGCKFINSDLTKIDIRSSDFRFYNAFSDCFIKFDQMRHSLPTEGNLRAHLCTNLAREARCAGFSNDEGLYRQEGAKALEGHLLAAVWGSTLYFREHYRGFERVQAAYTLAASRLRGYAWGYRRSWLVVLRNWAILTLVVFPIAFLACRSGLQKQGRPASTGDIWLASLGNILPGSGLSDVRFVSGVSLGLAFAEVLLGLLFGALIAALLFRSVFDRGR
jgi:hypothetical protein